MTRKILAAVAALAASKNSIAGASAAGIGGALLAPMIGFDPWPWIIGAVGGIIVRGKLPPTTRGDSLINGLISVMLAGLGAPWAAKYVFSQGLPEPSIYFMAFILSVTWPLALAMFMGSKKGEATSSFIKNAGRNLLAVFLRLIRSKTGVKRDE
jgi:hypothetical protein